jgi:hypothetical protein
MFKKIKLIFISLIALLLVSEVFGESGSSKNSECGEAKRIYNLCFYSCFGSTAGNLTEVINQCNDRCSKALDYMNSVCK